jgi:hypothetical protein
MQPIPSRPLADGITYQRATNEEDYVSLSRSDDLLHPFTLKRPQALALFRIMLDDLPGIAGPEFHDDRTLFEIDLLCRFHRSVEWLMHWSQSDLAELELLKEGHEQYQHAYELQEEMLDVVNGWQITLEQEYSKLEDAAEELDLPLDELGEEENDDGEEGDDDEE